MAAWTGACNFENVEIDGGPTKFKVFKVGVSGLVGARNFENFEIDGAPTKFKVFKVGPSAREPNPSSLRAPPFISSQPVLLPGRHGPCHEEEAGRQEGVLCQGGREQDFEEARHHAEAGEARGLHAPPGGGAVGQRTAEEVEAPRRPGGMLGGSGFRSGTNDSHGGGPGCRHRKIEGTNFL